MKCEIVQDLLPLYVDDVVSSESRTAIDDHLSTCANCQQLRNSITQDELPLATEIDKAKELKDVKHALRNRVIKISAISAAAALVVGVLGMLGIGWYQMTIPYRPGMISASANPNGDIDVLFHGTSLNAGYTSNHTTEIKVEIDGKPMRIVYFHLKGTFFDRFLTSPREATSVPVGLRHTQLSENAWFTNPENWVEGVDWYYDDANPIAAIYYLAANYSDMFDSPIPFMAQARDAGAVLVWQRPGIDLANATQISPH